MFKTIQNTVWAFDAEWVPDPRAGRLLYKVSEEVDDAGVMAEMWKKGGATEENPYPYLKTALCRIVSISMVARTRVRDDQVGLKLHTLPASIADAKQCQEAQVVGKFLEAVGKWRPQLVGFNSIAADIRAMVQRAVILGLQAAQFGQRPNKPWEGADYFSRGSDWNVDLKDVLTPGYGSGTPSLNEMSTLSGIPGKMEVDGQQVPHLWLAGRLDKIVAYNEFDAVTTYLLWLRTAHFGGHFTGEQYQVEQDRVRELLEHESRNGRPHLADYLVEWDRLRKVVAE